MDEERWIELETRVAFQERTLGQLDELVRDLFQQLGRVQRELSDLRGRVGDAPAKSEPVDGFSQGLLPDDD